MEFQISIPAYMVSMKIDVSSNLILPFPEISVWEGGKLYVDRYYREMAGITRVADWRGSLVVRSVVPDKQSPQWFTGVLPKAISKNRRSNEPFASVRTSKFEALSESGSPHATIDAKVWLPAEVFASVWKSCEIASNSSERVLTFRMDIFDDNDEAEENLKNSEDAYFQGHCQFTFGSSSLRSSKAIFEDKEEVGPE